MIYITTYDTGTLQVTADSVDSGFASLQQVADMMGPPLHRSPKWMTYPDGVAFSDFPFRLTTSSAAGYSAANCKE